MGVFIFGLILFGYDINIGNMLYLARHASTLNSPYIIQGTDNNIQLSLTGQAQAVALAKKLERFNIEKIISSKIKRAEQTAEIVGKELKIPVQYDVRLNEYNYGILTGWSKRMVDPDMMGLFLANPAAIEFKAEPWADAFARVGSFMAEQDYNKNTLVVTHSSILYIMMSYLENKNTFDIYSCWDKRQKYEIPNGAVLRIRDLDSEMKMLRNVYFCKMKERHKS